MSQSSTSLANAKPAERPAGNEFTELPGAAREGDADLAPRPASLDAKLPSETPPALNGAGAFSGKVKVASVFSLLMAVSQKHGVSTDDILGPRRHKRIVAARHELMRRAYSETRLSTTQLGRLLNRDHTVILYACKRTKRSRGEEPRCVPRWAR